jgi:hypothetical protein
MIQQLKRWWRRQRRTRKLEVHEIKIHSQTEIAQEGRYFTGKLTITISPEASIEGAFCPVGRTWYAHKAATEESANARLVELFTSEGWCWTRDHVKRITGERFYIPQHTEHTEHTEHT